MRRSSRCLFALVAGLLVLGGEPAHAGAVANDPVFEQGLQWGLDRIGAPTAWSRGTGRGVTIAVIDSGVDLEHQDLRDKVAGSVSCIGADGDPDACQGSAQDDNGHGTHVAGIALASTDNGVGIAGVAPEARLLSVRVLANDCDASGCTASGTSSDVTAGIRWAVEHGADVINLSLGGGTLQSIAGCSFCEAIEDAWSQGVITVIAAGNDSVLPSGFGSEHAVIVTATTRDDTRASYSSSSSGIVRVARWPVAAPGGEAEVQASDCATGGAPRGILSTYWPDEYACLAGTSMAAPHVAGALAILLGMGHTPLSAVERLLATATDLGPVGRDDSFGYGLIDVAEAVGPAVATTTSTTSVAPATPVTAAAVTVPPATATTVAPAPTTPPAVSAPETSAAAPYSPATPDDAPPAALVALAAALLVASATGTAVGAWRLQR